MSKNDETPIDNPVVAAKRFITPNEFLDFEVRIFNLYKLYFLAKKMQKDASTDDDEYAVITAGVAKIQDDLADLWSELRLNVVTE